MHAAVKRLIVLGVVALCMVGCLAGRASAQTGGLTVTPATLTLTLAAGDSSRGSQIIIANQYTVPVALHFAFERRIGQDGNTDPAAYLHISQTAVTLAAGEALHQTITLSDDNRVSPGSQLADLVITQIAVPGTSVGVVPSLRIPLVLVKQDGALSAVRLVGQVAPGTSWTIPRNLSVTIQNTGNMIAIPHGTITISTPNGTIVRQGVLNTSSLAVTPGDRLDLKTPLTSLGAAVWPGMYKTTVRYGLGGGQPSRTVSKRFLYIAWWHVALLAAGAIAGYYIVRQLSRKPHKWPIAHPLRKKTVLLGGRA